MKISLPDHINGLVFMRQCGYGLIHDRYTGHDSFVRRLGSYHYPRFHVYVENQSINLHLDQKHASYEGTSAHAGEYDGPLVEAEAQRIQNLVNLSISSHSVAPASNQKTGGWWSKFF